MAPIQLKEDQRRLYGELKSSLEHYAQVGRDISSEENFGVLLRQMAEKAHRLHVSLRESGHTPRHHKYMYENRGVSPESVEFYNHIHPIEDLLKFIDDPHANDDPVDQTMGEEFQFRVFSRRWGQEDVYHLVRTPSGWTVKFHAISGACNKRGEPILYRNFEHDSIDYPNNLGDWLEWLWDQAKEEGLSHEEVQQALDELAAWVSSVEVRSPKGTIWQGYKR